MTEENTIIDLTLLNGTETICARLVHSRSFESNARQEWETDRADAAKAFADALVRGEPIRVTVGMLHLVAISVSEIETGKLWRITLESAEYFSLRVAAWMAQRETFRRDPPLRVPTLRRRLANMSVRLDRERLILWRLFGDSADDAENARECVCQAREWINQLANLSDDALLRAHLEARKGL